jgi:hypothetical protein
MNSHGKNMIVTGDTNGIGGEPNEVAQGLMVPVPHVASYITCAALVADGAQMASKFGNWGKTEIDCFDGQRWTRSN